MARRRPADAENPPAEDQLPLPSTADLSNGKTRTPTEKLGRFFRTRPVSSLLLIIAICVIAMITFSIGASVGRALSSFFFPASKPTSASRSSTLGDSSAKGLNRHSKVRHLKKQWGITNDKDDTDDDDDDDDDDQDDAKDDDIADDEKGTLVNGVPAKDPVQADKPLSDKSQSQHLPHANNCYRKYEPGKLGHPKMLCITDEFFFDISIASKPVGRVKIGVFGEVVPKSAANFRALATCTGAFADGSLCYRGDSFHRVVTNFVVQGGSKATGRSIYGPTFREEQTKDHHSFLQHSEKGVVSWAEYPIGSQFYILTRDDAKYLDANHVVFGIVTEGLDVLRAIEDSPRTGEEPLSRVTITNCGDLHKGA